MVRNLIPKMFRYGACDWEMNNSEMILFDLNMSYFSTTEQSANDITRRF